MSFCLAGLAQLQQRLKEQLVLCQPRTALEGVALHDKVQADARTICATLVLSQKETCNLLAACSKCAEILQRRSSNFKWQMHQSARKIQCRARIFLARRLIRRQRKVRLRSRRMEERRRKREAAAAERAARAKARKAAWQTQLETGAAVSSEADEDVHLRRISSVRQKEEQRQAILNQRAKMLVELSKTSRWKIARESAPSTSNTVEAKAVRLQHKKKLAKQRVVERERRRRALRERAHERDIARRQKLTEMLKNRKAAQLKAEELAQQRLANQAARREISAKVAVVRANRLMERDPVYRALLRAVASRQAISKQ
eukprot:INCI18092.5.p1 GENE.INCI18092.5~~INCI18092.5.p1  ORF type:complete len:315 (+),score=67.23 INCI18092.5:863-1807(+)